MSSYADDDNLMKFSTCFGASSGKNSSTKFPEFVSIITIMSSYWAEANGIIDKNVIIEIIEIGLFMHERKLASIKMGSAH